MMMKEFIDKIFEIDNDVDFDNMAIEIFKFQAKNNNVYSEYLNYLNFDIDSVKSIYDIPFLPIDFFKTRKVLLNNFVDNSDNMMVFKSSGTTQQVRSNHYIADVNIYERAFIKGFTDFFGNPDQYIIFALLPSYLEAGNSSLVYMVNKLIQLTNNSNSGFYLNNYDELINAIHTYKDSNKKLMLFGVTYALLDIVDLFDFKVPDLIVIETGGMKGRKKELTRDEIHSKICFKTGIKRVHSEYGMTELLSQAYSDGYGLYLPSSTLKVLIRDVYDPFSYVCENKTGGINIIDLANIYSCSFIETKDLGKLKKSKFEVLGRFDNSDIRGCNLLLT